MDELDSSIFLYAGISEARCFQTGMERDRNLGEHAGPLPAPRYIRGSRVSKNIGTENVDKWRENEV
jgi:hypothetical protein